MKNFHLNTTMNRQGVIMKTEQYVCGRDESPETCFLCEQEGNDYCMICADRFTLEEYKTIQKEGQTS